MHAPTRPLSHAWVPAYLAYPLPLDATSPSERLLGKRCNSRQGPGVGTLARGRSPGRYQTCPPSRAPHKRLTMQPARAIFEAPHARDHAVHTPRQPTCLACTACRRPDISTCMPRSSEHTNVPGTRAGGGTSCRRSARASADQRPVVTLAQPAHQFAAPQPVKGSRHATASLLPLQEKDAPVRHCACAADSLRVLPDRAKIDGTVVLTARPPAPAPCAHCCTRIPAGMSKKRHGVHARQRGRAARAPRFPGKWHLANRTHRLALLGGLVVLVSRPAPRPSPL